jgi:squalene-hopene/tetraprenyl-beta-curcumene cyclase
VTTLAVNALWDSESPITNSEMIRSWLLAQQHRQEHPYTHAAPGGWAWTDLPGGVPDADDTSGALLALRALGPNNEKSRVAAHAGTQWLLDLQNRDGGIPTFCRGWGALPFDRSSPDITAHALRAWLAWQDDLTCPLQARTQKAMLRAIGFLAQSQRPEGAWMPLWFGNQFAANDENLTYGTSRVLCALAVLEKSDSRNEVSSCLCRSAVDWLVKSQNDDGGWGGAGGTATSVEETALAVEALAAARPKDGSADAALTRGANWLIERVESNQWQHPSPIGFYFAKLWYYEQLYPLIFTVGALKELSLCGFAPASRRDD